MLGIDSTHLEDIHGYHCWLATRIAPALRSSMMLQWWCSGMSIRETRNDWRDAKSRPEPAMDKKKKHSEGVTG